MLDIRFLDVRRGLNKYWAIIFIAYFILQSCAQKQDGIAPVDAQEFKTALDSLSDVILLDVRTPEEFESGHIQHARNLDFYSDQFTEDLAKLPKDKTILVYCKSGGRSAKTSHQLVNLGYQHIIELKGGMMAWNNANLPVEQGSKTSVEDLFKPLDYKNLITNNSAILIDFYATWCIPCKKMEPILNELSQEYGEKVLIKRINVDEAKALCQELGIQELPVVAIYKNGQEIKRLGGFQDKSQLISLIKLLE